MKEGSVAHAVLLLDAGCMIYDDDPRWPDTTISALIRRHSKQDCAGWGALVSGITYPKPDQPVRWFFSSSGYEHTEDRARGELRQLDLL